MCRHDCLNCHYSDCIDDNLTDKEISEIESRNHQLEVDMKLSEWMGVSGEKARHMRYRYRNEEEYKIKCRKASKKWSEKNKEKRHQYDTSEKRKAYFKEYYRKNKDKILEKRKERANGNSNLDYSYM